MSWPYQYTADVGPSLVTVLFMCALGFFAWRRRTVPAALPFFSLAIAGGMWALAGALAISSTDSATQVFWLKVYAASHVLPVTTALCFVLVYAGLGKFLNRRTLLLLAAPVLAIALLAFTDEVHHLMWASVSFDGSVVFVRGIANWVAVAYCNGLFLLSSAVLVWLFIRSPLQRWPTALILVGQALPRMAYFLAAVGGNPTEPLDPVIALTNVTVLAYALTLYRFHIFDVVPVAHDTIIEGMNDSIVVLDTENRIAGLNPAAQRLLGMPRAKAIGLDVARVLQNYPSLIEACGAHTATSAEIVVAIEETSRSYEVQVSSLIQGRGLRVGQLIVLHDVTENRRAQAQLLGQQRALAALEERERVARELHDGLGQVLGFVKMQAEAARRMLRYDPQTADRYLVQLVSVTQDAHADVREYILSARTIGTEGGFLAPLRDYLQRFSQSYGLAVELTTPPDLADEALDPTVGVQLLRIIQEALTNARKHARASRVEVNFSISDDAVQVVVEDDGQGFDPAQLARDEGQKFGLRFMRERAEGVGGSVEVQSAPGAATRIVARVPGHPPPRDTGG